MVELMMLLNQLDARELQIYNAELQSKKKSTGLAYVLWFFFGSLGIHRAYLDQSWESFAYFCLFAGGWCGMTFPPFFLCWLPLAFLVFFDIFSIPGQARSANEKVGKAIIEKLLAARPKDV